MTERITITRPGSTYLWASHSTKGLLDRAPFAGLSQIDVLCKRLREAFPYAEILDQTNVTSIVVQAPPTVIYLVQGEHWAVPGSPMTASATRAAADAKAAELVNVMLADCQLAADATATNWQEKLLAIRQVRAEEAGIDYDECLSSDRSEAIAEFMGDDDCDVWIDEIPVDGAAPPPADTYTAEDMDGVVAEVQDKIERRLLTPMRDALKAGRDALAEALTTHIYDEANGEEPDEDCGYMATIAQMDEFLARTEGIAPIGLPVDVRNALRNASGAISSLGHQIGQIRGIFGDADGAIEDAVDAGEEATAEIEAALERYEARAPVTIHVAVVDHRYGSNHYVGRTRAECAGKVAAYCLEWKEMEGVELNEDWEDEEVISVYFEKVNDETVTFGEDVLS